VRFVDLVGRELGPSSWLEVTQDRIDAFADATDDHQWIHVDVERATTGPFGGTVAHGYLTLSLVVTMLRDVMPLPGTATLNYGVDRVRFPAPLPSGSRIRGRFVVEAVEEKPRGTLVRLAATVELEQGEKPVCVADLLLLVVA